MHADRQHEHFSATDVTRLPVLITKLLIPPVPDDIMPRQRLIDCMQAGIGSKLTSLTAPAGFGKSTLVSAWARGAETPIAWLSLDVADNDPSVFLMYLISAIQRVRPGIGAASLSLLQEPRHPSMRGVMTALINDFSECTDPLTIVLDDGHVMTHATIHETLAFLIDRLPPQIRLIIASRTELPLPLSRWRLRGELTEIRAIDLRFTPEEISAFFETRSGLALACDEVAKLQERTEGWEAGLKAVALALPEQPVTRSRFIETFSGRHRYIFDYLIEEVLQRQAAVVQSFLLQTSILDRFCADLCDVVTQQANGRQMLDALQRANLFVVALDEEQTWYRYHHLFADVLRRRLQQRGTAAMEPHRRACAWFERAGLLDEAIGHAIAAQDDECAADLIEANLDSVLWRRGAADLFFAWHAALPDTVAKARPRLCLAYAWGLLILQRIDEIEPYLQSVEPQLQASGSQAGQRAQGDISLLRAEVLIRHGRAMQAQEKIQQALQLLSPDDPVFYGRALQIQGYVYLYQGFVETAARELHASYSKLKPTYDQLIALCALSDYGEALARQGQLRQAMTVFAEVIDQSQRHQHVLVLAVTRIRMANILREWNQLEAAMDGVVQGLSMVEDLNLVVLQHSGEVLRGRIAFAQGDAASAWRFFDRAGVQAEVNPDPQARDDVLARRIHLEFLYGRTASACEKALTAEWSENVALGWLVRARALAATGRYEEGQGIVQSCIDTARRDGRLGDRLEALVLSGLMAAEQGRRSTALDTLRQALELARPDGYIRVFADEPEPMGHLLSQLAEQGAHVSYIQTLLAAREHAARLRTRRPSTHYEELSRREMEVLRLLAVKLTNPQIADQLFIGAATVKTHTLNIYRKLQVRNRTEAIIRARQLRLV